MFTGTKVQTLRVLAGSFLTLLTAPLIAADLFVYEVLEGERRADELVASYIAEDGSRTEPVV